jgi:hypothetical protein
MNINVPKFRSHYERGKAVQIWRPKKLENSPLANVANHRRENRAFSGPYLETREHPQLNQPVRSFQAGRLGDDGEVLRFSM